ncbi:four-carbon acid sugar kinase family protein [Hoeflea sp. YIM 152468]|uniref:four-carbon acid sugar kinase family protein n=1 Tax=Hoeflea sp. YIM 152468 TaxID=3031759 RepID=UPI0023DC8B73|nr:four-carbon acid sugar kinase family protein [Hoeflea sp. YIM 152468]MDF1608896.1 four-carbon acid sugar kinase family protein [Hoeflea sp. YIM 152468]
MADPILAFYGDDFTGSSAVMEVLSFAGIPTVMFLAPPNAEELAAFPGLAAMGIAGVARSRDPSWMEDNLPEAFSALADFGAPIVHYKVCSTFDSSPSCGSIGKAIDIGAPILGGAWHPLIVGAPAIRRYQAFGNLFAGTDDGVYRLDRHPVMSRHPATPMDEADLRLHLSRQTDRRIGLVDVAGIKSGQADQMLSKQIKAGAEIVAIDVVDEQTLAEAGRLLWNEGRGPVFAIGSQGVEYALVAHLRTLGRIASTFKPPRLSAVNQVFCVSGSCSPINSAQIDAAESQGFRIIDLDATRAVDGAEWDRALDQALQASLAELSDGRDVIVATARGSEAASSRLKEAVIRSGRSMAAVNDRIGAGLGKLVADVRRKTRLPRAVVAGGDTSGHAMTALGVRALSALAPIAPGAPLCRVHSRNETVDGLEVTLKGGQMGARQFFITAKTGL